VRLRGPNLLEPFAWRGAARTPSRGGEQRRFEVGARSALLA
jgi:hypothetical protein